MMQKMLPVLGGLIVGLAIGIFVAGQLPGSGDEELSSVREKRESEEAEKAGSPAEVSRVPRPEEDRLSKEVEETSAPLPSDQLIGPALERHARDGIARGWRSKRQDEIPPAQLEEGFLSFVETVMKLPEAIGAGLAKAQTEGESWEEALAAGDATRLLVLGDEKNISPPWELLEDEKRLEDFFRPRHGEKLIDLSGDPREIAEKLEDGATLEFGAGVFDLGPFVQALRLKRGGDQADLADLTIRGAGMDNTLLVLSSEFSPPGHLDRLRIRDCTVHCKDHYLFDQRRGAVVLDCERVRIVGFDMGAGGSSMFNAKQGLASMKHCQILGGYSRAPVGFGNLYDVRSSANGSRFEGCLIREIEIGSHLRGHHLFVNCRLEDILDRASRFEKNEAIRLVGTQVSHFERRPVRHDLNDLFPDWMNRMSRN